MPGLYDCRFLPDQAYIRKSPRSAVNRAKAYNQHIGVAINLAKVRSTIIMDLDRAVCCTDGVTRTLREVLMKEVTYPLVPKANEKTTRLFATADLCTVGPDSGNSVHYLLTYKDREDLAEAFSGILPSHCKDFYGDVALQKWFNLDGQMMADEASLDYDDGNNWLGTWTTEDDLMLEHLAGEDRGVQIANIDSLHMFNNNNRVLTLEEQSFKSYKTAAGHENAPQQQDKVIPAGSAAVNSMTEEDSGAAG